jgi:hypothetical protein
MLNAVGHTGASADRVSRHLQKMLDRFRETVARRRNDTSRASVDLAVEGNRKDQGSGGIDNV